MSLATGLRSVEVRRRKDLGAFYTDQLVVDFLVRWGLSQVKGIVMDPSCGDGRFLISAASHGARQVIGCDLDPRAVNATRTALTSAGATAAVYQSDFFALDPAHLEAVDLVVGNPPFVRFQRFSGDSRRRAMESAMCIGVRLTALSSAWAPFLVHSIRFIKPGGAMAMVVPAEIVQTNYGLRTLEALCRNFAHVHLLAFSRNFFADAQAETYLLLAQGAGGNSPSAELHPLESIDQLADLQVAGRGAATLSVDAAERTPFALAFLEPEERAAWHRAIKRPGVSRIRDLGGITNGYVTGANDFFLTTREAALRQGLSEDWLFPTAVNAASLRGPAFTTADIRELEANGHPHHLLRLPERAALAADRRQLDLLLGKGQALGIHKRFKCRTRDPWWCVPGIHIPHLFLPYMVGREPIASVNAAKASYTNTIHGLKLNRAATAPAAAIGLHSTLTLLSMELHGRTYGGGILKLEPSEAARVHVALPSDTRAAIQLSHLLRSGDYLKAVALADQVVLRDSVGLSRADVRLLAAARERLVSRRYSRNQGRNAR
jgi:adenine-specific DNA-methyltransferase